MATATIIEPVDETLQSDRPISIRLRGGDCGVSGSTTWAGRTSHGGFSIDLELNTEIVPQDTYYEVTYLNGAQKLKWEIQLDTTGTFSVDDPEIARHRGPPGVLDTKPPGRR